ncbi:hypothetical protein [Streptomyces sp. NPDC007088]|uniref:hypothetical protein n=1 Tax=Streptomyces sp. NPDC007088 TaxID=3364773 RepID=UPI00368EEA09
MAMHATSIVAVMERSLEKSLTEMAGVITPIGPTPACADWTPPLIGRSADRGAVAGLGRLSGRAPFLPPPSPGFLVPPDVQADA